MSVASTIERTRSANSENCESVRYLDNLNKLEVGEWVRLVCVLEARSLLTEIASTGQLVSHAEFVLVGEPLMMG